MNPNPPAIIIIGTNGTGKTYDALAIARRAFRCLYFTAQFPSSKEPITEWWEKGGIFFVAPGETIKDNEAVISRLADQCPETTIIIDDARMWVAGTDRLGYFVAKLFARRRHIDQPIVYVCHGIKQVPNEVLDYEPTFFIKKTTGKITQRIHKQFPDEFWKKVNEVNKPNFNRFKGIIYKP